MKRSDLIKEMVNWWETSSGKFSDREEQMFNLLLFLECGGMAPPEVAEPVKTSVLVATPHGYVEQKSEDSKVFVRKWEDEA